MLNYNTSMTFQERMYKIESDLIINTIYQLQKGNIGSANFQQQKLRQLGVLDKKNFELIEKGFKEAKPLLLAELEQAQRNVVNGIDKQAKSLSLASRKNIDQNLLNILKIYETKAIGDMSLTSSTMIKQLNSAYIKAVDDVVASKLISGEALQKSVEKLTKTLLNSGVTSMVDVKGRHWTLEAYSNMVLRSNTRQVSTQTQLTKFDEYDIDLVEISSHIGARPKCALYQGNVFSRSGKNKLYPALSRTSMGEPDGLFGINCGHRMYIYIPGTPKTYDEYGKKENEKAYEESQKQRSLERKVRNTKQDIKNSQRSIRVADTTNNKSLKRNSKQNLKEQNKLLREQRQNLKDYTEEVGRTYRPERTTVY